jgi:hypothetical protein
MFLIILNNKYTRAILELLIITIILVCAYYIWKIKIQHDALISYNAKQIEQITKDTEKLKEDMFKTQMLAQDITGNMTIKNNTLTNNTDNFQSYINSVPPNVNRPASDLLKNTIKNLNGIN